MASKLYDVIIIGGGPGGLTAATFIARQAYSTLVLDSRQYRNEKSNHMHTIPGWDHVAPAEFRAKARSDLEKRYPMIEFKDAKVDKVRKGEDGIFVAEIEGGKVFRAKKLGLATGVKDIMDGEPKGFEECWTKGIFHCLFCHGFEERGVESVGVLATGSLAVASFLHHIIPMAARFATKNVTIYTNNNSSLHAEAAKLFKSPKVTTDNRKIQSYALKGDGPAMTITFEDGSSKEEGFCVNQPKLEQRGPFAEQLGLEMGEGGADIKSMPPFFETSVKGCFAAGDAATPMKSVLQAMYMGGLGGAGMVMQLGAEADEAGEL